MAKAGLLFVGTEDGIVLFSDPGGVGRWRRVGQALRGQAVRALALEAGNPLTVLAAGASGGLQRSADGGQTWQAVFDAAVSALVAGDRHAPQTMYLGTSDGLVYRSDDAGTHWTLCPPGGRPQIGVTCLALAAGDARRLVAGLQDGSVWVSADGGATWTRYGSALPAAATALAIAPAGSSAVYATAAGTLYRCGGPDAAWERIGGTPQAESGAFCILAGKDPVLLLDRAGGGISRSDDDGATWTTAEADGPWAGSVAVITPSSFNIDVAFAGSTAGRLGISTDRGRSWQMIRQDLPPIWRLAAGRLA